MPREFPVFAEWSAKPDALPVSIVDTGPVARAFLPVNIEDSNIVQFEGTGSLFDARVVCVRPVIEAVEFDDYWTQGYVSLGPLLEDLSKVLRYNGTRGFVDELGITPSDKFTQESGPNLQFHGLSPTFGGLVNQFDPTINSTIKVNFPSDWSSETLVGTLANIDTGSRNDQAGDDLQWHIELGHASHGEHRNATFHERGSWLVYMPNTTDIPSFEASLCFDSMYNQLFSYNRYYHPQDFPVTARKRSLKTDFEDPAPKWDSKNNKYDTRRLPQHLGAAVPDSYERNVFDLDIDSVNEKMEEYIDQWDPDFKAAIEDWNDMGSTIYVNTSQRDILRTNKDILNLTGSDYLKTMYADFLNRLLWNPTVTPTDIVEATFKAGSARTNEPDSTSDKLDESYLLLHPVSIALVEDILEDTDNPALAWQALTTSLMGAAYRDWAPYFTVSEPVTTILAISTQFPQHQKGFWIVVGNLVAHFALVTTAFIWFLRSTQYSLLNNPWQAVSQLIAPETKELLENATMADGKQVQECIRASGREGLRFKIKKESEKDRVCLLLAQQVDGDIKTLKQQPSQEDIELVTRASSVEIGGLSRRRQEQSSEKANA
ncbi:uncharacterized protein K452DRAFT_302004 [Aplosporella prunicola CBS 121167]|uniref:Uncharacterized protein n=1 Tax=Aplosporella prunicola CBS 121167 TaxID=1176127 RepID=A0A6A6B2I0_9PEZI|nr:uncharacterized protein K452DRAFT_302004 [Aplosporella prunicola CBS 121167]KAF2137424.1 hypothetical protein K452DRAFT_302004 [Aplosporella prunicola CBS 121167]